jgi:NADH:ubiquinone oxidoreductase subunit 2 (subunit N)
MKPSQNNLLKRLFRPYALSIFAFTGLIMIAVYAAQGRGVWAILQFSIVYIVLFIGLRLLTTLFQENKQRRQEITQTKSRTEN